MTRKKFGASQFSIFPQSANEFPFFYYQSNNSSNQLYEYSFTKTLLSQNFLKKKTVRVRVRIPPHTVWKVLRFSLTHFWQKFRESKDFTKEITKELIWRKNSLVRLNFSFFHTVPHSVERREILCHATQIFSRQINLE